MPVPMHILEKRKREDARKTTDIFSNPIVAVVLTIVFFVILALAIGI